MLVLTVKVGEHVTIDDRIIIRNVGGSNVRLGFEMEEKLSVVRSNAKNKWKKEDKDDRVDAVS